jgi:hypothetical protein
MCCSFLNQVYKIFYEHISQLLNTNYDHNENEHIIICLPHGVIVGKEFILTH